MFQAQDRPLLPTRYDQIDFLTLPLILLILLEMQEPNMIYFNVLAGLLCISRILHSISLLFVEKILNTTKLRMLATALTIIVVLITAFSNIVLYFITGDSVINPL